MPQTSEPSTSSISQIRDGLWIMTANSTLLKKKRVVNCIVLTRLDKLYSIVMVCKAVMNLARDASSQLNLQLNMPYAINTWDVYCRMHSTLNHFHKYVLLFVCASIFSTWSFRVVNKEVKMETKRIISLKMIIPIQSIPL